MAVHFPHGPVGAAATRRNAAADRAAAAAARASPQLTTPSRWRIDVGDDGSVALAASLPHSLRGEGGSPGWQGLPGEVVLDADLVVPIRQDMLELWAFTGMHLAVSLRPSILAGRSGRLASAAAVPVPPAARLPRHHHVRGSSMRLVDPSAETDRPGAPDRPAPSGRSLPLQDVRADFTVATEGPHGRAAAASALRLAALLEERFGVEEPLLLGADGGLRAGLAAPEDQQPVRQFAGACGLLVEPTEPADLRADAARPRAEPEDAAPAADTSER